MPRQSIVRQPIVLVTCNYVDFEGTKAHIVKHQYIRALLEVSNCTPLLIPATGADFRLADIADRIDGILLTGSPSHVSPDCYGAKREFGEDELDCTRDSTTLPLIKTAIERDIPLFAICRGFQELNVARGGTLQQYVHKQAGMRDHRPDPALPIMERYLKSAHKVQSRQGGMFERLQMPAAFLTNSIHQQGVDKLGTGLHVEAVCDDGLIESISLPDKKFILGTQWHPEGDFWVNEPSRKLFEAFGESIRSH
jgi:putative glutamine amidotransferase